MIGNPNARLIDTLSVSSVRRRKRRNLGSNHEPRWVAAILEWPLMWLLARLVLLSAYLFGGVTKLFDFSSAISEQAHFGLEPAWLWASMAIVVELGGSFLILINRLVWLGAGGLGVLTVVAMAVANKFWDADGSDRIQVLNGFLEHAGLVAGFVLVAMIASHRKSTHNEEF
jgi:uncharacterized membrane protein YphA (DoxX/SURF4 family)